MAELEEAQNIGPALAAELRSVGVDDLERLRAIGAAAAWERLRSAGLRDCANSRLALEGAVRAVPWSELPKTERDEIGAQVSAANAAPA